MRHDCLVRLYPIFKVLTADRVFWKCFNTSTVLSDILQTRCNKCLFHRQSESQQSAAHTTCLPLVFPPVTFALWPLAFYPRHTHPVLLIMPQPPHPNSLGSQGPRWCTQAATPAARACPGCFLASSDPGRWPYSSQAALPNTLILCNSAAAHRTILSTQV